MRHIHTSIVSRHLATRGNNKILCTPSPHIRSSEEILPCPTCRIHVQLRTNKSPFLKSYLHKVDAKSHHHHHVPFVTLTHTTHIISSTASCCHPWIYGQTLSELRTLRLQRSNESVDNNNNTSYGMNYLYKMTLPILLISTVQYSTVQYSTVQYSTVQYSTVQYSTVQYSTVQYSTVRCSTGAVQHSTVQHGIVQYSTTRYSTAWYSTVQYSTVHHSTVRYSTVQYSTV